MKLSPYVLQVVAGVCCAYAAQTVLQAKPENPDTDAHDHDGARRVLTPALKDFIHDIVTQYPVPGLTLGVVHGDDVEFGAWGRKTEDDDPITIDVSTPDATSHIGEPSC